MLAMFQPRDKIFEEIPENKILTNFCSGKRSADYPAEKGPNADYADPWYGHYGYGGGWGGYRGYNRPYGYGYGRI